MAPKARTTQGQRKYCAIHKSLGNHTTSECKGTKKTDDADKRCYLCNKTGHTMTTCPRRKDAIDTDEDGKYVATKQCWNGCGGNHLVSDCKEPLCIKVTRMNKKAYFESKADGRDFIPVRREQVMGGEKPTTPTPSTSPATAAPTPTIPVEFMTLDVRASCSWDGEKIGDLLGELATVPDVNITHENGIETLALSFSSEHELVAAQNTIGTQQDGNGEHFIVRRRHTPTTPCPAGATLSSTLGTQVGEAPWAADMKAIRTDHQKLERKVNVMGNRINKLSNETDRTQAFMLEFAEFSGMTNARAVMANCGKQEKSREDVTTKPTPDTVHSPTPGQLHVESIQLACTCALCCCYALCMKREELSIFYSLWLRCSVVMLQYVGFLGRSQLFGSQVKVFSQVGAPSRKLARQKSGVGAPNSDLARQNCQVVARQVRLSRAPTAQSRAPNSWIGGGTLGARQLDSFGAPT